MKWASVVCLSLLAVVPVTDSVGQSSEPPREFAELSQDEQTNPEFAYINPDTGQMGIEMAAAHFIVDGPTDRFFQASPFAQVDVSLPQAAQAYAAEYAGGSPEVATAMLQKLRSFVWDPAYRFVQTKDLNSNGLPDDRAQHRHYACRYTTLCSTAMDDGFGRRTIVQFTPDYFTLGPNRTPPPPRPPNRDEAKEKCLQEARDLKRDVDQAFIAWGVACGSIRGAVVIGSSSCVAAGVNAANLSERFMRKVKECESL